MGEVGQIVVFMMTFSSCNTLLDLSGVHYIEGTWMGSTTLPCTYIPSEGFTEQTLSWSIDRDSSTSTIFRRDGSGDHILLSKFRDRVSVPKHSTGNASLLIENLEMPDSGHYTCQVTWRSTNNTFITREVTTTVKVVKVAATKPTIRAGQRGLTVPAGASTSLTCEASGSPPISYRWFRGSPGGKALLLSSSAELAWDSLRPSDSGTYFCEAANRAGAGAAQQSDAVELTVTGTGTGTDLPTTTVASWRDVGTPGRRHPTTDLLPTMLVSRMDTASEGPATDTGAAPAALLVGPAAALAGAALGALGAAALGWRRRRRRKDEPLYEVAFTAGVMALESEVEAPVKCLHKETCSNAEISSDTLTMKDRKSPEYENLVTAMESEY
ncbi:V-set and immunoglobulin domain-containing protein 4-like isoform X2 [Pithys albifrons albifrons]|uniref:V-set and immunoglobulin domain-containing protein 4-like isoform X2 n=1 Tax=Pithys albifrons albifrons TaxID=3385563 RepID=UPI003A5D00B2